MKTRYLFSFAALALMMGACSSDEDLQSPSEASETIEQTIPFRATISKEDVDDTRGLIENEEFQEIYANWEVGEKVALIYDNTVDSMTVESVEGNTAIISGKLTGSPKNKQKVQVVFRGSKGMDNFQKSLKTVVSANDKSITQSHITEAFKLMTKNPQGGTLENIADGFDFRTTKNTTNLLINDGKATFNKVVQLASQVAIWKLAVTTDGTTPLKVNTLEMTYGKNYVDTVDVDLGKESKSDIYVAFVPNGKNVRFLARDAEEQAYTCEPKLSKTLKIGNYYRSRLIMTKGQNVESVKLDSTTLKLTVGEEAKLTATVFPDNALDKTLEWSSQKSKKSTVAVVSADGTVKAVGKGTTTITVTATNGTKNKKDDKEATCTVTVVEATQDVESVTLDKDELTISLGAEPVKLTATVLPADGANKTVVWASSNEKIAVVDGNGYVTPVSLGKDTIYVTATNGTKDTKDDKTAACEVTVSQGAGSISYKEKEVNVTLGDDAFINELTKTGDGTVTYTSSNTNVATVGADGKVTIKGVGTATITATVADSKNYAYATKTATYTLTVIKPFTEPTIKPSGDYEDDGDPLNPLASN